MREIDYYFLQKDEPVKSCLLFLRDHILDYDEGITEAWKYRMPFYCYKGKMFCYLWTHKKNGLPYIGIVEGRKIDHPLLIQEERARMKIMLIDPTRDLPLETIGNILKTAIELYE
ncbi:DUF1801 domain-containing protein [Mucilaginibacter ginsenosidivorans]|uniref:DUF1801 domain-containing protein n=1 Tax=Mucilaginibacter ginsenosidivorans TaxID=398053 RepID=A0A5B8UVZ5_9SPHI|nr:DUF1801 domain-containing protein [Mucilaginibacter ginsenosidivorans]QEC63079.1 DUF1801 domain-containing protein [Mucilaginibacter ginsenosidivorans]